MRQLEQLIGEQAMRDGLQRYLDQHRFGNATWTDLITILDERTTHDLATWSRAWVDQPGRPEITTTWTPFGVTVRQRDTDQKRNLQWTQAVGIALAYGDTIVIDTVTIADSSTVLQLDRKERPDWILAGVDGVSYAHFVLDTTSRRALLSNAHTLTNPMHRAVAMSALWESMLDGTTTSNAFIDLALRSIPVEREELLVQQQLGFLRTVYWRFLSDSSRLAIAPRVESTLWAALDGADTPGRKASYWSAIVGTTLTETGLARLKRIWQTRKPPEGLPLSEQQYTSLAEELALRIPVDAEVILDAEAARITNPDRRLRFAFVRPSLSPDSSVRDSMFESLRNVENRRRESWATDALRNLNHPLRAQHAQRYIAPGLALVDEIQRTGDIFFPLSWMNALLDGHQSAAAADAVVSFLNGAPELQPRLRGKLLQAADDVFRSARIVNGWRGQSVAR